jgi:hypothetical protein
MGKSTTWDTEKKSVTFCMSMARGRHLVRKQLNYRGLPVRMGRAPLLKIAAPTEQSTPCYWKS